MASAKPLFPEPVGPATATSGRSGASETTVPSISLYNDKVIFDEGRGYQDFEGK
jgi:hypothetical protein